MKELFASASFAGAALTMLTFFIGTGPAGTDDKAWLRLPGGLTFQPAELLKIAFIITFSLSFVNRAEKMKKFSI